MLEIDKKAAYKDIKDYIKDMFDADYLKELDHSFMRADVALHDLWYKLRKEIEEEA